MKPTLHARLPNPLLYYRQELPSLVMHGEWAQAPCPFHNDRNPSLSVNITSGGFICFACGAKGGDIIDFHRKRYQLGFRLAVRQIEGRRTWRT